MATDSSANPHPVTYFVTPQMDGRNRLTCAFRIILAIPHLIIVGGPGGIDFGFPAGIIGGGSRFVGAIGNGVLGALAIVLAIVSWFAIVFTGSQPRGLWDLTNYYLRWRSKAVAYMALLRDEYPPFGDGEYPVDFGVGEFPQTRNRWSVGLRIFYVIPQAIVLFFLGIAWFITAVVGWFAILFTGAYPDGLYRFAIGYVRWSLRVEAYFLLIHDEYPPFSLE
jgi:Domain of unknown function (DUF4389)